MKKVTITLDDEVWNWWKKTMDKFISTSRKRIKKNMLTGKTSTRNLSGMRNPKFRFDGKIYTCSKYGYIYK